MIKFYDSRPDALDAQLYVCDDLTGYFFHAEAPL